MFTTAQLLLVMLDTDIVGTISKRLQAVSYLGYQTRPVALALLVDVFQE